MSKNVKLKLASLALAGLSTVASGSVLAANMTVDSNGGLEVFELDDTNYWFKIGGRVHFDQAFFEGGETDRSHFPSGAHVRRARVTFKGGVGNNWVYKLDVDYKDLADRRFGLVGDEETGQTNVIGRTKAQLGEAFIAYNGCPNWWFALGQVSVPYSLEGHQSSNETTFMEAALPVEAFGRDTLGLGIYAEWHGDMFTFAGAIYQPDAGSAQIGDFVVSPVPGDPNTIGPNGSDPGSDPLGYGARLTFSPVHTDSTTYHFGVFGRYQNLHDSANTLQFNTPTEVRSRQSSLLTTNMPIRSVKDYRVLGLELAGQWDNFVISGEYIHTKVEREGSYGLVSSGIPPLPAPPPGPTLVPDSRHPGGDQNFDGYYVAVSWIVTGEVKDYDFVSGTFGRVRPKSSKGAWELAARHSYVKLVDTQEMVPPKLPLVVNQNPNNFVGAENSTTLGVTWWVNNNVRFLLNYVHANLPDTNDINVLGFRAQVNW